MNDALPARKSRKEMEALLIEKAWNDESFRRRLVANPFETIQEQLEVEIPDGVSLSVVEESAEKIYLVIPENPFVDEKGALSDEELETVAGGARESLGSKNPLCLDPGNLDPLERARIAGDRFPFLR